MSAEALSGVDIHSNQELTKMFISNGGEIFLKSFTLPAGNDEKSRKSRHAFALLEERVTARKEMREIQQKMLLSGMRRICTLDELHKLLLGA